MITRKLPELNVHADHTTIYILIAVTSAIALSGILFAVFKYKKDGTYFSGKFKNSGVYKLLANQYFMPHMIENGINKPYLEMSKFSWKQIDMKIIDAIVDFIAKFIYTTGNESRVMQTGNLSKAIKWMVFGLAILIVLSVALSSLK